MTDINPSRWPCLQGEGLRVFNITADQRYLLGEEIFLKTHFPMQMRRYQNYITTSSVTEKELMAELAIQNGSIIGNRVFFLYGAAGAGKSELLRWLQATLSQNYPERSRYMVRINRNELDLLSIIEKFQSLLPNTYFNEKTYRRWEEARRKPRTVAKLILLSALEKNYDSDTTINTLFYRLLEWIQPRIERVLTSERVGEEYDTPVELLSRQDLEELKEQSVFKIDIEYEEFRSYLSKAFQDLLLEGSSILDTLQSISINLTQEGYRPILLIDDLVQSLSIFSTDLLDYFITLDDGAWDVVIGLTPNALADNERGQKLLDRISYLDTFDDRVLKLFLSDERGDESYFLNVENCVEFLVPYLDMFRSINKVFCDRCPYIDKCNNVFGEVNGTTLAPFNNDLLRRIFKSLPDGKGKARQFLRMIREILSTAISSGQIHDILAHSVKFDIAVESTDKRLSSLVECYYPSTKELKQQIIGEDFLSAFNFNFISALVNIQPLRNEISIGSLSYSKDSWVEDPNYLVVKDWLDGKSINRQSLQLLRRGTSRWLRDVLSIGFIHRSGKPKPHRILRWQGIYLDVKPPILIEGVDNGVGIYLSPNIGLLAFHLSEYAIAVGSRRTYLAGLIASNHFIGQLIQDALHFQTELEVSLEMQLRKTPAQMAAELIALFWMLGDAPHLESNPLFKSLPLHSVTFPNPPGGYKIVELARLLFEDFYMLRDNLFDYTGYKEALGNTSLDELSENFSNLDVNQISSEFTIGNILLGDYLSRVQQRIQVWKNPLLSTDLGFVQNVLVHSFSEYGTEGLPFASIPFDVWSKIRVDNPEIFNKIRIYLEST